MVRTRLAFLLCILGVTLSYAIPAKGDETCGRSLSGEICCWNIVTYEDPTGEGRTCYMTTYSCTTDPNEPGSHWYSFPPAYNCVG